MKCVWLGIKDYCKDCWHDWLSNRLHKSQSERLYTYDYKKDEFCWVYPWKEGSVWHYIRQRKIGQYIIQKRQKRGKIDNMLSNKKLWGDKTEEEIRRDVYAMVNGLTDTKKTKYVRKRGKK